MSIIGDRYRTQKIYQEGESIALVVWGINWKSFPKIWTELRRKVWEFQNDGIRENNIMLHYAKSYRSLKQVYLVFKS